MFESRLTRELFESGGEDAYVREAVALSAADYRDQSREEVHVITVRAVHGWRDPAMRKTFERGYGGEVLATIGMCYLIASNEEWEDLDVGQLMRVFDQAIRVADADQPDTSDAADRAWFPTMGLARGWHDFADAKHVLEQHHSVKRMSSALQVLSSNAMAIPKLKRRHRKDYADATFAAMNIGSALGVLDRIGEVPGSASTGQAA